EQLLDALAGDRRRLALGRSAAVERIGIVLQERPVAGIRRLPLIQTFFKIDARAFEWCLWLQRDGLRVGADRVVEKPLHILEIAHDAAPHDLTGALDFLAHERNDRDVHPRPFVGAVEYLACRYHEPLHTVAVALFNARTAGNGIRPLRPHAGGEL